MEEIFLRNSFENHFDNCKTRLRGNERDVRKNSSKTQSSCVSRAGALDQNKNEFVWYVASARAERANSHAEIIQFVGIWHSSLKFDIFHPLGGNASPSPE